MIIHETTILVESRPALAAARATGLDPVVEILPGVYATQTETWWECAGEMDAIEIGEDMTAVVSITGDANGVLVCLDEESGTLWREMAAGPGVPDHARFTPLWTAGAIRAAFGGLRREEWAELLVLEETIVIACAYSADTDVRRRDWLQARLSRPQREAFEAWWALSFTVLHPDEDAGDG